MSDSTAFHILKNFVEQKPVFSQALQHLEPNTEIRITIEHGSELALYYSAGKAYLEDRPAQNPDVEFVLNTESIRFLSGHPGDRVSQFGIDIVKEIIAGNIQVRICGQFIGVLSNGYLKIIKEAGPEFSSFLATHGLKNISKVIALIRRLKP